MLILASQSPRRAALLEQAGIPFQTAPADIDETRHAGEPPVEYVSRIALAKARAAREAHPDAAVLGADTAVVVGERVFGKPRDRTDAIGMLLALSNRTHEVLTAVALVADDERQVLSRSRVRFRRVEPGEAEAYWATGEPADKAGAYAIQGLGATFVAHIDGSYSGIMGLPLFETLALLRTIGVRGPIAV
jgi:septum formation protein